MVALSWGAVLAPDVLLDVSVWHRGVLVCSSRLLKGSDPQGARLNTRCRPAALAHAALWLMFEMNSFKRHAR